MSYLDDPMNFYGSGHIGTLANPFRTQSNYLYPRNMEDVVRWSIWLYERQPMYRTAIQKVVSYFIAGLNVVQTGDQEDSDPDDVENFKKHLEEDYNALDLTLQFGIELAAMGNAFVSCERIFSRMLLCPKCPWEMSLKQLTKGIDYEWKAGKFTGTCPRCHEHVTFKVKDVPTQTDDGRKLRFVFRNVRDMHVQYNQLTGSYKFLYKLPDYIKDGIKKGDPVYLEDTPSVFMEAAMNNKMVVFPEDKFFHSRTRTISAMDKLYKGWGLPIFMPCFDEFIRMQHLDKFNEAITMDYIAPVRVLSPQPQNLRAGMDDPNRMPLSGAQFRGFINSSLKQVKENPTTWIVSPVPVQYQMLGGEGKQLAPVDLMEWYKTGTIADMGIPQEFKQTTFQVVAPSMGMRMFERQWGPFAKSIHQFTRWMGDKIAEIDNIENMRVDLDITSFVEDDMNKQVLLSLMQSGLVAKTPVFSRFGIDFQKNLDQLMQEQKAEQEAAMDMQTSEEGKQMVQGVLPPAGSLGVGQATMAIQAAQGGGGEGAPMGPESPAMPAGPEGAVPMAPAMAGGGQRPGTADQAWDQAYQMAQQLYNAPPNVRRSELTNLKANDPQMHAFVTDMLRNMEQQVASDAVAQSKQPQG